MYKRINKHLAMEIWKLPKDKKLILMKLSTRGFEKARERGQAQFNERLSKIIRTVLAK